jgi:hypothetical protein
MSKYLESCNNECKIVMLLLVALLGFLLYQCYNKPSACDREGFAPKKGGNVAPTTPPPTTPPPTTQPTTPPTSRPPTVKVKVEPSLPSGYTPVIGGNLTEILAGRKNVSVMISNSIQLPSGHIYYKSSIGDAIAKKI